MTTVLAYVPDLMDRSKVMAAAGAAVTFVAKPAELTAAAASDVDVILVDLARAGVVEVLADLGGHRIVGFGSHVDRALLQAARDAGCTEVLARSEFFRRLPELVA